MQARIYLSGGLRPVLPGGPYLLPAHWVWILKFLPSRFYLEDVIYLIYFLPSFYIFGTPPIWGPLNLGAPGPGPIWPNRRSGPRSTSSFWNIKNDLWRLVSSSFLRLQKWNPIQNQTCLLWRHFCGIAFTNYLFRPREITIIIKLIRFVTPSIMTLLSRSFWSKQITVWQEIPSCLSAFIACIRERSLIIAKCGVIPSYQLPYSPKQADDILTQLN